MTAIIDAYRDQLSKSVRSEKRGDFELIVTPHSFPDGDSVVLLVERTSSDQFLISDRGLLADFLADQHVNLDQASVKATFQSVVAEAGGPPVLSREARAYELLTSATTATVGERIGRLAEGMLAASGLRVLGRSSRKLGFGGHMMTMASQLGAEIVPNAPIPTKIGTTRRVTFTAARGGKTWYVIARQADRGQLMPALDHAYAVFANTKISLARRVTVLPAESKGEVDQIAVLTGVSKVHDPDTFATLIA